MKNVTFLHPEFFWLLLLLPVAAAWLYWKRKQQAASLSMSSLQGFQGTPSLLAKLQPLLPALRLAALACLIVAMARPRTVDVTNKTKFLESSAGNTVDFALVSILPTKLQIDHLDLLPNNLYLVGKKEHRTSPPLSKREALSALPFIFREQGSGTRQAMESYFQRHKIQMEPKLELTSNEAVKQAVIAGLGFSIMPLIGIRNEIRNKQVHIFPAAGLPLEATWRLIWLKGKKHSPVAKAYLDHLREAKQRITQAHFDWIQNKH